MRGLTENIVSPGGKPQHFCVAAMSTSTPIRSGWMATPPWELTAQDGALLAVLVVVCTVLPWMWSLRVLKVLSPYTLSIAVALEPVYSMAMAAVLWPETETLSARFYLGSAVLIALGPLNVLLRRKLTP